MNQPLEINCTEGNGTLKRANLIEPPVTSADTASAEDTEPETRRADVKEQETGFHDRLHRWHTKLYTDHEETQ